MKVLQKCTSFLLLAGLLAGCAVRRENQEINKQIFAKPSTVVIVQVSGLEKPVYFRDSGNTGLIGALLVEMMGISAAQKVSEIDPSPLVADHYHGPFRKFFEEKNFKVKLLPSPLKRDALTAGSSDPVFSPVDFRFLRNEHGVEYALIIDPEFFGVYRTIGLGGSSVAKARLKFYLVNLASNALVGYYNADVTESVLGDWDTPPDYRELTASVKIALIRALNDAYRYFSAKNFESFS